MLDVIYINKGSNRANIRHALILSTLNPFARFFLYFKYYTIDLINGFFNATNSCNDCKGGGPMVGEQ
jgi:hypothetical protein